MLFFFWLSLVLLFYTYFGYPILLLFWGRTTKPQQVAEVPEGDEPCIAIIIPVHNEERVIEDKIRNSLSLEYPQQRLEIIIVSDGSTDGTEDLVNLHTRSNLKLLTQSPRQGKAAALNAGIKATGADVVVFSDASIMLDPKALKNIVAPFQSPTVGCVSGEDHISEGGGEGLYGQYELFLRNLESRVGSVVGASGCFYAQRRVLCTTFREGMAPDFLSVLATVEQGYRAVTCPSAIGSMQAVSAPQDEYARKVRTFVRGMTTLGHFKQMLNPFRYGFFAIELVSHKLMRWFSGLFLIALAGSSMFLLHNDFYALLFLLQLLFYAMAMIGWKNPKVFSKIKYVRIAFYFCLVNVAALVAWFKFLGGMRQELWEPSRR